MMIRLPNLLTASYNWSLDDLPRLSPLQLCLSPWHHDYDPELFPQLQYLFFVQKTAFLDRRIAAARNVAPLVALLQQLRGEGQPAPLRSQVASRLGQAVGGNWAALGARSWKDYANAAEDWGFVRLIPDDRNKSGARIEVVEGATTPLVSPMSWTSHDIPLQWSIDRDPDLLLPSQLADLPTNELVALYMLLENRTLAGHIREEFFTRRDREDAKIWSAEGNAWLDAIVPRSLPDDGQSAAHRPYDLPPSTTAHRPYASSRYPSSFDEPRTSSILKRRGSPLPGAPRSVQPPLPPAPSAPNHPPTRPSTPPRTPPCISAGSAPTEAEPFHAAPTLAAPPNPPPSTETSSTSTTSSLGFQGLITDISPLPCHLTRQLRVLRAHYSSADPSLSFLPSHLLPDAAVQRPTEGDRRVVELAYSTLEQAMLALQEVSTAEIVERVDLIDAEEGGWAWKDVLALSKWGRAAWEVEMDCSEQPETGGKRVHEGAAGSQSKRARQE